MTPPRDLLFGLIAIRNGLVDRAQLDEALRDSDPTASLAARAGLDADDRAAIEAVMASHLRRHGGDAGRRPGGRHRRPAPRRVRPHADLRRFGRRRRPG
ncbi:MAG: hypothetical protein U0800_06800 [Isosphaeraceae bacterium]